MVDDARRLIRESGKDLEVDGAREGEEILLHCEAESNGIEAQTE